MKRHLPLLLILVLLGSLGLTQAAGAASRHLPATASPPALRDDLAEPEAEAEDEDEDDAIEAEDDLEAEECLGGEAEAGDGEELEEEPEEEFEDELFAAKAEAEGCIDGAAGKPGGEGFVSAPAACRVREAESTVSILPASDRLRLVVRYQTYAPGAVTVGLRLKDRKGSLTLTHATRHLGPNGVLKLTTTVDDALMERAEAARELDVSLRAAETPGFCAGLLEQHLHRSEGKHKAGASRTYRAAPGG